MVRSFTRTRRLVVVLVSATLALTGLSVVGLVGASAASASDSSMFGQVNASRESHGRSAYAWNDHLAAVAAGQAARMAKQTKLYHNPNLASDVGNFRWVGENVGYGPSSNAIETAFMNSAPHRANILDGDYTQIGIASVRDAKGRLWVAQVFREPSGSSASASKPAAKSHKTTAKHTTTHRTRSTSHAGNASAPAPTQPAKDVNPVTAAEAHQPAPTPTLAQRVDYATSNAASRTGTDPLADALAFAATMNAIGG